MCFGDVDALVSPCRFREIDSGSMDVLHRQVDNLCKFEHEIWVLKDFKTPSKRSLQGRGRTPHTNRNVL